MKDSNIPKFLRDDLPLFNAIIQDLFPDAVLPDSSNKEIENAINVCLKRKKLIPAYDTVYKIIQLFQTTIVRFGSMVVGEAMCGKSVVLNTLQDAVTYCKKELHSTDNRFNEVESIRFNPKSITMGELYGEENQLTQDWTDGLASYYIREAC